MLAYKVYADRYLLLDTYNDVNDGMVSAQMNLEVNQPGSFEFSLVRGHPHIDDIRLMKTRIAVKMMYIENDEVLDLYWAFLGRVNSIDEDMYGNKSFTCEGAMAYLNDCYEEYNEDRIIQHQHIGEWLDILIDGAYSTEIADDMGIPYDPNKAITTRPAGTDYGYSDPFYISSEPDKDAQLEWQKILDIINDTIINAYGGILNFVYIPPGISDADIESGGDFTIHCKYFNNHNDWFMYEACKTDQPEVMYIDTGYYDIPTFSFNTNMTDISSSPIKTGIWTCLLPIGKDGINIKTDSGSWNPHSILVPIGYLRDRYGVIVKQVDFSTIENSSSLLKAARDYNNRFMHKDWYSLNNYTVRGIEPCLTTENDFIIRLGYPVKVQINDTEETIVNALSIKHNLFDVQASEYGLGPIVPKNIIDEDISSFIK